MDDSAKRGPACTVATGGLPPSGPGFAPLAEAAVTGVGNSAGPDQATGSAGARAADSAALSVPLSFCEASPAPAPALRKTAPANGASANSIVAKPGRILPGNSVRVPIDLGLDLCSNSATGAGAKPSAPGAGPLPAGPSATTIISTTNSGGISIGTGIGLPGAVPVLLCVIDVPLGSVSGNVGDQPPASNDCPPTTPHPSTTPAHPSPPTPLVPPRDHVHPTKLAETGGGDALGFALPGSALLAGLGLRAAGRHRMQ